MTRSKSPAHGLALRFRPPAHATEPPDLTAFCRPARTDAASVLRRPTHIGTLGGDVRAALKAVRASPTLVVFFEHGGFSIPPIGSDAPHGMPDLDAWSLRPTRFGWLAAVPRSPSRKSTARAAWIVAACLPLALPSAVAQASAPARSGTAAPAKTAQPVDPTGDEPAAEAAPGVAPQRPTKTPPTIPPFPTERTTDLEPPTDPPPPAPAAEAVCPEPVVAIPEWILEGKRTVSVVDAAWEGVIGYDVALELKGGRELDGRVTAVQPDTFTLIHRETGVVRVLQKSAVAQLRVRVPKELPTQDGVGMLVGGGLLTAIGTPVFLTGAVFLGICPSCVGLHVSLLVTGAGALGGGIPLIVGGSRRRRAYNEARATHLTLAPAASVGKTGWNGGIRLRF